jgi:response regulator NasT
MTAPLRVAVADDEPLMRQWYERTLDRLGHRVVGTAADGGELVRLCREHGPDLVITDIKMPGIDGLAAAAQIRTEATLPVILVSAHDDAEFVERALENQVLAYLVKPIKEHDLATAISLVMRR